MKSETEIQERIDDLESMLRPNYITPKQRHIKNKIELLEWVLDD